MSNFILEAFQPYWLSPYVLPSGPEDGLNHFVFLIAIQIVEGAKSALAPLFLWIPVFANFLWERFPVLGLKLVEFPNDHRGGDSGGRLQREEDDKHT